LLLLLGLAEAYGAIGKMGRPYKNRRRQEKPLRDGKAADQWNSSTKPEIFNYLSEYRRGCTQFYHYLHADHLNRHILSKEDGIESPYYPKPTADSSENREFVTVGGIPFPVLCEKVFQQPYLLLPPHLTSKQRRFIHHCCVQAEIFHDSIDDPLERRQMVISCYADGFDFLPSPRSKKEPVVTALHQYKPWYYRRHRDRKKETQAIKDAIWKYIDQPGLCLRDHHDRLEYLSSDPSLQQFNNLFDGSMPNSAECMRVETAAQMKHCIQELSVPSVHEIGFDLESYQVNEYSQITCVLQITTNLG
jgi:hypothetical protein